MFNIVFWEYLQNVALVVPTIGAIQLWSKNRRVASMIVVIAGCVLGTVFTHFTEPLITGQPRRPVRELVFGIVVFSLAMAVVAIYLGSNTRWANWKTDLILGIGMAVAVGIGQAMAEWPNVPVPTYLVHGLATCVVVPSSLILLRRLRPGNLVAALGTSLLVATLMTVVMIVDYLRYVGV